MYGAQTKQCRKYWSKKFENDVEMYGAQTDDCCLIDCRWFENDVEMYGAQTSIFKAFSFP